MRVKFNKVSNVINICGERWRARRSRCFLSISSQFSDSITPSTSIYTHGNYSFIVIAKWHEMYLQHGKIFSIDHNFDAMCCILKMFMITTGINVMICYFLPSNRQWWDFGYESTKHDFITHTYTHRTIKITQNKYLV